MNITAAIPSLGEREGARQTAAPDATDGDAEAEAPLSADELFHLLQNSRRRAVIRYLRGRRESVWMRDVAEQVAAWEHDTTVAELTSDQRQRVYIALYQSHLETLEEAGLIAYDKSRGVVEPEPLLDRVATYVERDPPDPPKATGDTWSLGYLGVSLVSTLLLLGIAIDLSVLQLLSGVTAGVLVLLLFSTLTVAKLTLDDGRRE